MFVIRGSVRRQCDRQRTGSIKSVAALLDVWPDISSARGWPGPKNIVRCSKWLPSMRSVYSGSSPTPEDGRQGLNFLCIDTWGQILFEASEGIHPRFMRLMDLIILLLALPAASGCNELVVESLSSRVELPTEGTFESTWTVLTPKRARVVVILWGQPTLNPRRSL